ncbi:hypothetical protein MKP08_11150 [Erythrobacter sp. LQ02-29]|uniref:hypothetical protein n=1 Tax=unclassified Erythrobacter TaxID=2633097 RepID=UPI001BFC8EBF|nr:MULTISPECIES: hypothetical protein [unclassified Erythrobacter]MCP9223307.1 hypothetical protein [Erythrobacter sp. LQ02-29]QWC58092.1 hypothetical protein F7D01_14360 [Erythrobacter sp. 3-20A1M]
MKLLGTLVGLLMMAMGTVWILQGQGIAFLGSFMAYDRQWTMWGAVLLLAGLAIAIWSNRRRR